MVLRLHSLVSGLKLVGWYGTHVAWNDELKVKERRRAIKLTATRLKSWSEKVDAF
jgi:hypothetical protein